jgi:hypothetical protein
MKLFAGLEAHGFAGRNAHLGAGPGIASNPRLPWPHVKNPKTSQFNSLSLGEGALQGLEYRIHGRFGLIALQAGPLYHVVNNVLFYQCISSTGSVAEFWFSVETFSIVVNASRVP